MVTNKEFCILPFPLEPIPIGSAKLHIFFVIIANLYGINLRFCKF